MVLSRDLATSGHFPSIDVLESISRVVNAVTDPAQRADATRLRRLLAALLGLALLAEGLDQADAALTLMPHIESFLRQGMDDVTALADTWQALHELVAS